MALVTEDIISTEIAGTLDGLMYQRIRRTPDITAYRSFDTTSKDWRDTSWKEVGEQISRWQAALATEQLQPGDRVAVHLRNSKEWVFFDQAALACGLVIVPLYTDDRPDNVAYILSDSAVKVLLMQDAVHWKQLAPALNGHDDLQRVLILNPPKTAQAELLQDRRVRLVSDWLPGDTQPLKNRQGDPQWPGVYRVYLRYHRASEGCHAEPSQHVVDCAFCPDHDRCLPGGPVPVLFTALAYPGTHRRLLSAGDVGFHGGLCPLDCPARG
jgi:non-ribosomal peptide synthetase component F